MRTVVWEPLYNSVWHQPISFWILQGLFLAIVARRPLRDRAANVLVLGGTLLAALDAGLTQLHSPVPAAAQTYVGLVFVILGDWRYWIVFSREMRPGASWARCFGEGAALALVVPVAVLLPQKLGWIAGGRPLYLTYELGALGLALLVAALRRARHPLVGFWVATYGLWALADVVILWRGDVGFLLRLLPNTLYYGCFWPVVYAVWLQRESR